MRLYVYALADAAPPIDDLTGIQHEPLHAVPLADAVAILGRVDSSLAASRGTLEAQDRLVRTLHARASALLPARFGTIVADAAALVEHPTLQPRVLTPALARVRGREQMTVRLVTTRPQPPRPDRTPAGETGRAAPRSGRQYLERRAAAAVPRDVHILTAALEALVVAEHTERGRVPGMLGTVYHLIDRGRSDDYRRVVGVRAGLLSDVSVVVSGPSPAYAFGPGEGV